ncbi:hypothetical protein [Desulfovibrio desulfuricans]|uniref:hypothetical protein n=1 Tax=Desulfovibrio desulfuricans TaxID=876 RepID=UPI0003B4BFA9|nr:hypothetical protein [Desulfovibrio desulfuricans]QTO41196.1 hypothetical protein J8J02_04645 [Desulfovibrio desulfuricans]
MPTNTSPAAQSSWAGVLYEAADCAVIPTLPLMIKLLAIFCTARQTLPPLSFRKWTENPRQSRKIMNT